MSDDADLENDLCWALSNMGETYVDQGDLDRDCLFSWKH